MLKGINTCSTEYADSSYALAASLSSTHLQITFAMANPLDMMNYPHMAARIYCDVEETKHSLS